MPWLIAKVRSHRLGTSEPGSTPQPVLGQGALKACIGLRVVIEVVEELGDLFDRLDNNVSQTAASIDGIMTDADAKAACYLPEPC